MTLQALTYFAAAAEEGNLTRAAKRCFVTQPALSRAIAELERELGCPLLIRKNKGVSLTPAGEVCLSGARRILKECGLLARQVHEGSGSTAGTINIGYLFNGSLNFFAGMLKQASQVFPHIELHTTYEHFKDAKRMLKTGELDFVLLAEPSARGLGAVDLLTVFPGGLYVVAHHTHRLFAQESVTMAEIKDETFMLWDPLELPYLSAATLSAFRAHGIEPKVASYGKKLGDMIAFATLKEGLGVTTCAASAAGNSVTRILPISDCRTGFDIKLARAKNNENPAALTFFEYIRLNSGQ